MAWREGYLCQKLIVHDKSKSDKSEIVDGKRHSQARKQIPTVKKKFTKQIGIKKWVFKKHKYWTRQTERENARYKILFKGSTED